MITVQKTASAKNILLIVVTVASLQLGCRSPNAVMQAACKCVPPTGQSAFAKSTTVETISETATIEDFVRMELSRNPRVMEVQHKFEAIQHRVPQVLSLPDPMVNTNTYVSPVQTAAGEQNYSLGVSQKVTNAQRRVTKAAIVQDEVAAAQAELNAVQLEIAERIRSACYQLMFVRKSIEITSEDRESLKQIADVILRQYEVKKSVTQQDVLNVQVEQSKIENQITELKQKEKSFQARLARLIHVDPNSSLQLRDDLKVESSSLDADSLIAQAIESRPDLRSQLANINLSRKKIHLAHLESKPDFTVGVNWIATSTDGISPVANGDDALLLGVGFNVPINRGRIRAGICEAQANQRAAHSRLESMQDIAAEEVFDLVAKLESTRETLSLVQEDIIPKAERTLSLSIERYATDGTEYVQLIADWRSVLRYQIAEASLQSQYNQLLASLNRSIGGSEPVETLTAQYRYTLAAPLGYPIP